jgi:hypothetical protein
MNFSLWHASIEHSYSPPALDSYMLHAGKYKSLNPRLQPLKNVWANRSRVFREDALHGQEERISRQCGRETVAIFGTPRVNQGRSNGTQLALNELAILLVEPKGSQPFGPAQQMEGLTAPANDL